MMAEATASDGESFNGYGHVPGHPVGSEYVDRRALSDSRVHRPLQAGICGTARAGGAESIVLSGGYKDDRDYGETIIYTGHGGQDRNTKRHVKDQTIDDPGNAALVASRANERPVRVVRRKPRDSPHARGGFSYDGLYLVEDHWSTRGRDGFLIWQFRLERIPESPIEGEVVSRVPAQPDAPQPRGEAAPPRANRTSRAIVRASEIAMWVKQTHNYVCQICGKTLELPGGVRYAETAHIQGLGEPHNGPDVVANTLCLCPNDHKLFDLGAFAIDDAFRVIDFATGKIIGSLRRSRKHKIDPTYLAYHRESIRRSARD